MDESTGLIWRKPFFCGASGADDLAVFHCSEYYCHFEGEIKAGHKVDLVQWVQPRATKQLSHKSMSRARRKC